MSRSGTLELAKECSEYKGLAGDHCTITSSNLDEIAGGSQIVYANAVVDGTLDTDVVLNAGPGNAANGHVMLNLAEGTGTVTLSGGTGTLSGIQASADISADAAGIWHWQGTYSFADAEQPVAAVN